MKTRGNEFYYSISGITVPKYEVSDTFEQSLDYFANHHGREAVKLTKLLESQRINEFVASLEELDRLLCSIHAYALETETARLLRLADLDNGMMCKLFLPQFISNMETLANEIKISQGKVFLEDHQQGDSLTHFKQIVTYLRSFLTLARNGQFDKIMDIALTVPDLHEGMAGLHFIQLLLMKDEFALEELIKAMIDDYTVRLTYRVETSVTVLKKVLVVDDQPEILVTLTEMLRNHYQVFALSDSKQVLQFLGRQQVDAFILDIDMPEMDGLELSKQIKKVKSNRHKPIMFLTSLNTKDIVMKALFAGGVDYVTKPINQEVILEKLERHLSTSNKPEVTT